MIWDGIAIFRFIINSEQLSFFYFVNINIQVKYCTF